MLMLLIRQIIDIVGSLKKSFSLLHLVGLRPRVYYTVTNFKGGGVARPLWPPLNTPMRIDMYVNQFCYHITWLINIYNMLINAIHIMSVHSHQIALPS